MTEVTMGARSRDFAASVRTLNREDTAILSSDDISAFTQGESKLVTSTESSRSGRVLFGETFQVRQFTSSAPFDF